MLERLFTSKVRIDLLAHFILHPGGRFHIRGLERSPEAQYSAIWRELENLEQAGVIVSEADAVRRLFRLNLQDPLLSELQRIILKTAGLGDQVRDGLERLEGLQRAFVFGSFAAGQADAHSDIDLMVIGEVDFEQLSTHIAGVGKRLGRSINVVTFTRAERESKLANEDPFALEVVRSPKLMLIGSEDEL